MGMKEFINLSTPIYILFNADFLLL
jgi:hypothetical protein